MREAELFAIGLGLSEPWKVTSVELKDEELHVCVDFERGARFEGLPVHDTQDRTWQDLSFFRFPCFVHARVPRVKDSEGKVSTVQVPWARAGSSFTLQFEAAAMRLVGQMPVRSVARELGITDTRLWRIVQFQVNRAHAQIDLSQIRRIAVDETAARRGHHYITVFVDLDRRSVVFACEGRSSEALEAFGAFLQARGVCPSQIQECCSDMSPAYLLGIATHLPQARITLDKFHLVAMVSKAVDEIRRGETKRHRQLTGTRYWWLKNPAKLTAEQARQMGEFLKEHSFLQTAQAYGLRLEFQEIFRSPSEEACALFLAWIQRVFATELRKMHEVAVTFFNQRDMILNWFQTKISNGILEALHSVLQAIKNKARGYRNTDNLIAMSYLIHGKLPGLTHTK